MLRYEKPSSLSESLALLRSDRWRILAGGTDLYPAQSRGSLHGNVLDINGLADLRGISETGIHVRIGAGTTWTQILRAGLPPAFSALQQAAREIGSQQIQNVGTLGGNLCNASPAADGIPVLMILDALVELSSWSGRRILPLAEFVTGNRRTALRPEELLSAILLPKPSLAGASSFIKFGARRYLVISIAMAAARLVSDRDERVTAAAVAVGSCSPAARRLPELERALIGRHLHELAVIADDEGLYAPLSPIDDVRGSASYRLKAAREIVARALREAGSVVSAVADAEEHA